MMDEREFAELSAGHALNALSPAEEAAFQEALAAHPEWAHHASADADTVALLSEQLPSVTPPPALRASVIDRIASLPQNADTGALAPDGTARPEDAEGETPRDAAPAPVARSGGARRRWFALVASVVLVLGLGFGAVTLGQYLNRPAAVIALEQIEQAPDARSATVELADGGEATAHWSATLGRAVLVSDGLPELDEGKTYEAWFVRGDAPISAGVFAADDGEATAELSGQFHSGDVIAVTVEPAGGAPGGQPTSDPVLAIQTA